MFTFTQDNQLKDLKRIYNTKSVLKQFFYKGKMLAMKMKPTVEEVIN